MIQYVILMFIYSYSAKQVIGPPNVPQYGDNVKAWTQGKNRNYQNEFLHVSR